MHVFLLNADINLFVVRQKISFAFGNI